MQYRYSTSHWIFCCVEYVIKNHHYLDCLSTVLLVHYMSCVSLCIGYVQYLLPMTLAQQLTTVVILYKVVISQHVPCMALKSFVIGFQGDLSMLYELYDAMFRQLTTKFVCWLSGLIVRFDYFIIGIMNPAIWM